MALNPIIIGSDIWKKNKSLRLFLEIQSFHECRHQDFFSNQNAIFKKLFLQKNIILLTICKEFWSYSASLFVFQKDSLTPFCPSRIQIGLRSLFLIFQFIFLWLINSNSVYINSISTISKAYAILYLLQ